MGDGEHNKVDRYGKKYSWIAYFELGGWLQDQGLLSGREDDGRTWDVDIDPSFPSPTPEHKLVSADLLGNPRTSLVEWISKGPVPDLTPYLRQSVVGMESGPWVALDGFVAQVDETRGRRLFAFARAFLVARKEAKDFIACLTKQPLGGRWLPEKPECHYTFTGEIPWCDTYPETGAVNLRFVVKERNAKVRRKRQVFFLDDQPIELTRADLLALGIYHVQPEKEIGHSVLTEADLGRITCRNQFFEVEEIHQETRKFRTFIPVQNFGWEGRKIENIPVHGITLAKRLARSMGLVHLPQTHDLQTKDGIRATYGIAFRPEEYHQGERFFFIREDILRSLLRKHDWELVWAIWGERELSYKQIERARPDGDLAGFSHANFQAVYRF